jgi:hypothetical protein
MIKMYQGINGKAIKENRPLTRTELQEVVPSVFQYDAHESRSNRFAPVPTIDVIDRLAKENYFPMFATQARVRDASKREFTKHMLRFRQPGMKEGEANEIILLNANDGTSAYQLISGQFRFVCANGLVMGNTQSNTKIYHKGNNIMDDVIEGVCEVVKDFDLIERYKGEMSRIQLTDDQRKAFAIAGYIAKEGYPEPGEKINYLYDPQQLLSTRIINSTDRNSNSLYSTFNVVQQNVMAGGQTGRSESGRRRTTRGVTNIDKNLDFNSKLWNLATMLVDKA